MHRVKLCLGLLIIAVFMIIPISLQGADVIAYVGEVGGKVMVIKANPGETVAATLGMLLSGGDTVKTADESYAAIIFQDDGSRVKLGANAQLTLNATRKDKNLNKSLFLDSGKLWAKVTKRRGTELEVKTPTSVASVKGTRFILEEKEWGETWLWVLEDVVKLKSSAGETDVNAGEWGKATKDSIETGSIKDGDIPVEPGKHEMIIYFKPGDESSSLMRELRIEFER
ncbi:MAG: FecR family protein [Spirochaetota bacterium]